jgi:predicted O-linked N-acetylglucosamine transferase (SPINDLY family)
MNEARAWAERFQRPLLHFHPRHEDEREPKHRLRIGYVSPDLRDHVVGRNVLPIFEQHDHHAFEIHAFSLAAKGDESSAPFRMACDHWHECAGLSDDAIAHLILKNKIDILIDLSLHMQGNRLGVFARKPAPVQATWAGYPGTTGLSSIDFRITDPYLDPPGETDACYSERSIRLPHSFWCYRPSKKAPDVNPLPAIENGSITFGCLNNFSKINSYTLTIWSELLRTVRDSKLVVLCPSGSVRSEFSDSFETKGIDRQRLRFADRGDRYFHHYHDIDICLDPLPYTGHTTTLDALWMGVPMVTLRGNTSVARGSVTALSNTNLVDLIARTSDQYASIAQNLAGDLNRLTSLRNELRNRLQSSPICDEAGFTRNLENAFREMWHADQR